MRVVIDTNVLLVANEQHEGASPECVQTCVRKLQEVQAKGIAVIDDANLILNEYRNKTRLHPAKGVGDVFLKGLLRQSGNPKHVEQVSITPVTQTSEDMFVEFPDPNLQLDFDAPDRKFVAVSYAHPQKPVILQAVDCKWLDWWPALRVNGITVEFLCPQDICSFYKRKFPTKAIPNIPASSDF
jgi:hypothetical protein